MARGGNGRDRTGGDIPREQGRTRCVVSCGRLGFTVAGRCLGGGLCLGLLYINTAGLGGAGLVGATGYVGISLFDD